MLLSIGRKRYTPTSSERESIHNYYEQMVIEQILRSHSRAENDADFLADVACIALNQLPARYVRHDVDMTFFLTPDEMENMINDVVEAVNKAVSYVEERERNQQENS